MPSKSRGLTPTQQRGAKAQRKRRVAALLAEDRPQTLERNGYVYVKRLDPQRGWEIAEFTKASYARQEAWLTTADQREAVDWMRQQR